MTSFRDHRGRYSLAVPDCTCVSTEKVVPATASIKGLYRMFMFYFLEFCTYMKWKIRKVTCRLMRKPCAPRSTARSDDSNVNSLGTTAGSRELAPGLRAVDRT